MFIKIQNKGEIKKEYEFEGKISNGETSQVGIAIHRVLNIRRAIKVKTLRYLSPKEQMESINEVRIAKQLDHPNIMKIYEFYEDPKHFFIVTELCNGGELLDRIVMQNYITESMAAFIIK